MDETHQEGLERVSKRIAPAVLNFCGRVYVTTLKRFHAGDLHDSVLRDTGILAPASADRVLRHLRQAGRINYRVLSRKESLYEMISIGGKAQTNGNGA